MKVKTTPETVLIDAIRSTGLEVDIVAGKGPMSANALGMTELRVGRARECAFDDIAIPKDPYDEIILFPIRIGPSAEDALKARRRLMKGQAIHLFIASDEGLTELFRPRVSPATQRGTVDGLLALLPIKVIWYPLSQPISPESLRSSKYQLVGVLTTAGG